MAGKNRVLLALLKQATKELKDQIRFPGNCPPSPPLSFIRLTLTSHLGQNDGLVEDWMGSFPEIYAHPRMTHGLERYGRIRVLGKCMEIRPHFVP